MLVAAGALCGGFSLFGGGSEPLLAQAPSAAVEPIMRIAAAPSGPAPSAPNPTPAVEVPAIGAATAAAAPTELQLQPPINSTLEIRVARRPWLLDKLTKPKTEPSVKMNPPRPPAELPDPPSMSRLAPDDGWVNRRRGAPAYADLPAKTEEVDTRQPDSDREGTPQDAQNRLRSESTDPLSSKTDDTDSGQPAEAIGEDPVGGGAAESTKADSGQPTEAIGEEPIGGTATESTNADSDTSDKQSPAEAVSSDKRDTSDRITPDSSEPARLQVRELRIDGNGDPLKDSATPRRRSEDAATSARSKKALPEAVSIEPVSPEVAPPIEFDYAGYPKSRIRMTNSVYRMRNSMRQCLSYYHARPEIANERSNWGMLHSIMVYGIDTRVMVGRRSYSAIAWIAGNNACRGQRLLTEQDGMIVAKSGVGLQGHQAQMLAVFSLCGVPAEYPLYAGDNKYSVNDIIDSEMLACKSGEELTFTLIGLSHYLDTDAVWRNAQGEVWDFERLIQEELAQSIVGAACGGTHRLMGFAHALRKRRAEGRPMTGQWKRAEMFTRDFVEYAYRLQNRDGSMTTDWFEGREDNGSLDRKIQTTGHIVEWLLTVTPDSQLQNPRLVSAIRYLLTSMYEERDHDWKIGPKGHALRSLAMYYERVYQSGPAWQKRAVAESRVSPRR